MDWKEIRLLSKFALFRKIDVFCGDVAPNFSSMCEHMFEKFGAADSQKGNFNKQMEFRKKSIKGALTHLFFPALCIQCTEPIFDQRTLLCHSCIGTLIPLDPETRCLICSAQLIDETRVCEACRERRALLRRIVAPFAYTGAPKELLDQFLSGRSSLKTILASYMVLQWLNLDLPFPDAIVPVAESRFITFRRGFSHSQLLAEEVAHLLERPVLTLLGRRIGDFPQRRRSFEQRKKLSTQNFFWKEPRDLSGQTILLVDDLMGSCATLRACAEKLIEGFPERIYGLTFCIEELW